MNVAVTGSTGYLGGHVLEVLRLRGHELIPDLRYGFDALIFLAWRSKAGSSEPKKQLQSLDYFREVIDSPYIANHCRVIFPSSAAVYGVAHSEMTEESQERPTCTYSHCKLLAERELLRKFDAVVFRFGSLMGQGMTRTKYDLVVNAFADDGYRKGLIEVWNPDAFKPILHVRDAAAMIVEALERDDLHGVYNAAADSLPSVAIAEAAARITGAAIRVVEDRSGLRSCRLDCAKLRTAFPQIEFRNMADAIREFDPDVSQALRRTGLALELRDGLGDPPGTLRQPADQGSGNR